MDFRGVSVQDSRGLKIICGSFCRRINDRLTGRFEEETRLIFESLNSTGKELSQADLIRNFILMGLDHEIQSKLYKHYWRPMEVDFGQEAYAEQFDSFMRHYLTMKTGVIPNISKVYESFKLYSRESHIRSAGTEVLVKDISIMSTYYCKMALNKESDHDLKNVFHDLRELKVDVAYPLLLVLYNDYSNQILSKQDFITIVRLIEAYVFRRSICGIPTNSLNKTFAAFIKYIDKEHYLESITAHFVFLPSYRRFPNNDEFMRDFKTKDLYNFRNRSFGLRRIENHDRKERVPVDEYTIEHIMPQNEELSDAWIQDLGDDWERIHQTWLHTLGNLTLTGYNSEYSDKPFLEKRDMPGGFKQSPLRLNQGLGSLKKWDEDAIINRAEKLSLLVTDVWKYPVIAIDTLKKYKNEKEKGQEYSINDHPYLLREPSKSLFTHFVKEVTSLDRCISMEFRKLYVAFKAETNFVDIVPQAKRLLLIINMKFHEIDDPKNKCRNVANLGRWGNGDIEVGLSSLDELPYILSLVRQSLEKQMSNDGDE